MSYTIKPYTFEQAFKYGVYVGPSSNPKKKIDVYDKDLNKIASVGAIGYADYPTYLEMDKKLAEERRRLYKARHKHNMKRGTPGYWANVLLW